MNLSAGANPVQERRPDRIASLLAWWQRASPTGGDRGPVQVGELPPRASTDDIDRMVDRGADLLLLPALAAPTAEVVALMVTLTGQDEIDLLGWPVKDDVEWTGDLMLLRERMGQLGTASDSDALLAGVHPMISQSARVLARCVTRRTAVIFQGTTHASAALLAAMSLNTSADHRQWLQPACEPSDNAGKAALERLELIAAVDIGDAPLWFPGHQLALATLRLALNASAGQSSAGKPGQDSQDV